MNIMKHKIFVFKLSIQALCQYLYVNSKWACLEVLWLSYYLTYVLPHSMIIDFILEHLCYHNEKLFKENKALIETQISRYALDGFHAWQCNVPLHTCIHYVHCTNFRWQHTKVIQKVAYNQIEYVFLLIRYPLTLRVHHQK